MFRRRKNKWSTSDNLVTNVKTIKNIFGCPQFLSMRRSKMCILVVISTTTQLLKKAKKKYNVNINFKCKKVIIKMLMCLFVCI